MEGHKCDESTYTSLKESAMKEHKRLVHKVNVHACKKCAYQTSYRSMLQKLELEAYMKVQEFNCNLCQFTAPSKEDIATHMKSVHFKTHAPNVEQDTAEEYFGPPPSPKYANSQILPVQIR